MISAENCNFKFKDKFEKRLADVNINTTKGHTKFFADNGGENGAKAALSAEKPAKSQRWSVIS